MKTIAISAALLALTTWGASAQPTGPTQTPASWVTLNLTANLNQGADAAWEKIGGNDWCGIAKFLDVKSCSITAGKGEIGSLRMINGSIVELVVARTNHSYTYAQPFTPIFYHGTLAVEPVDATHSKLSYVLIWNDTAVGDAKAQADNLASRHSRFQAAVDKMAAAVNGK